ncbi:MAG TPA: hypothetical protein VHN11_18080 [Xanthobacteraceae bacterium]|nr:hypothetical protein [Xanthobacteraceae bacterium]
MRWQAVWIYFCMVTVFGGSCTAAEEWKPYRYPKDGFVVEFPSAPKPEDALGDTRKILRFRQYWVDGSEVAFGVGAALYRHNVMTSVSSDQALRSAIEGAGSAMGCSIRSEREVTLAGTMAREVVFDRCERAGMVAKQRFYVVGDWLYQAMVLGTIPDLETAPNVKRFLESFGLIAE